jgi:hypothetical protein
VPKKTYSESEVRVLESFPSIPNFNTSALTFVNTKKNIIIEDAIRVDQNGNLIFKDNETEVTLKDLLVSSKGIEEEIDDDGSVTLYFLDDKNQRVSLGRVYELLFKENVINGVFWFGERSSEFLDDEMDEYIVEEFYNRVGGDGIDPRSLNILLEETDSFKNIWFDVPCIEVITPEYVDNKYASITAKVCFKIKCELSTITAFRIYDATVGLELARNVQIVRASPDNYITYTVPLSYQGPLPDSIQERGGICREVTIDDLQNVQYENGIEKGEVITRGDKGYVQIPNSRHIIKLQWATCSSTIELDTIGNPVGEFNRKFDSNGETSLDVVVYDKNSTFNEGNITQLTGSFEVDNYDGNATILFSEQSVSIDTDEDYVVEFSTNKNFEVWILNKSAEGFTLAWNRSPRDGVVDWIVIQNKRNVGGELETLNDEDRALNHNLFGSKEVDADFCGEVPDAPPEIEFFLDLIPPENPDLECKCCDCCADISKDDIDLEFLAWGGNELVPACNGQYYSIEDSEGNIRYSEDPSSFEYEVVVDNDLGDCVASVVGGDIYEGKLTVNINSGQQFVSLLGIGVSLRSETYTDSEGKSRKQYQTYFPIIRTMRNTDDVWVESYNNTGFLIKWDTDGEDFEEYAPKNGVIYWQIRKSVFISPEQSVSVALEPKKEICFPEPTVVSSPAATTTLPFDLLGL